MRDGMWKVLGAAGALSLGLLGTGCGKKTESDVERIQKAGVFRVAIVDTGSRYTSVDEGKPTGLEPELAEYISQALGTEVQFQVYKKKEALEAVSSGEADVAMGCINGSGSLAGEYRLSLSYGKGYFYGVTRAGDYALTIGALENSSVGVDRELDEETRTMLYEAEGIRISDFDSAREGGEAVKDGRIRAYICYEDQAGELLSDPELQVQNVSNLEPEEFVVAAAGSSDPALISGIDVLIRQFLEKE